MSTPKPSPDSPTSSVRVGPRSGATDPSESIPDYLFIAEAVSNRNSSFQSAEDAIRFVDSLLSCPSQRKPDLLRIVAEGKFTAARLDEAAELGFDEDCSEDISIPLLRFACDSTFEKSRHKAAAAKFIRRLYCVPSFVQYLSDGLEDLSQTSQNAFCRFMFKVCCLSVDARASDEMNSIAHRIINIVPEIEGAQQLENLLFSNVKARTRASLVQTLVQSSPSIQSSPSTMNADVSFIDYAEPESPLGTEPLLNSDDVVSCNKHEAEMTVAFCRHTLLQGKVKANQIIILTPFADQVQQINHEARKHDSLWRDLAALEQLE